MAPSSHPHRPPRPPGRSLHALRRQNPGDRTDLSSLNCSWLAAYAASADAAARLHWRNRLVEANLGLVHRVAARFNGISHLPYKDLVQVGSQGLIRAVEAFDLRRTRCLSTFAVPYVRGAIQHEIRDREAWIRPPRPVWELHQRSRSLVERRRVAGLPPLDRDALAQALGCSLHDLDAAQGLRQIAIPLSLDAPQSRAMEGEWQDTWLDQVADPRSLPREAPPQADRQWRAERLWLRQQLRHLDPLLRELVLDRVLLDCTWAELGQRLGLHPRMAERRCNAVLRELRTRAEAWRLLGPLPLPEEAAS
ncbi:MAG: hypothetical protein RLZZ117_1031 [Cyanobacteriota bacterium]